MEASQMEEDDYAPVQLADTSRHMTEPGHDDPRSRTVGVAAFEEIDPVAAAPAADVALDAVLGQLLGGEACCLENRCLSTLASLAARLPEGTSTRDVARLHLECVAHRKAVEEAATPAPPPERRLD